MGKFPEYSLDHIIGKLIQQKFMTTYSDFFQSRVMGQTVLLEKSSNS